MYIVYERWFFSFFFFIVFSYFVRWSVHSLLLSLLLFLLIIIFFCIDSYWLAFVTRLRPRVAETLCILACVRDLVSIFENGVEGRQTSSLKRIFFNSFAVHFCYIHFFFYSRIDDFLCAIQIMHDFRRNE